MDDELIKKLIELVETISPEIWAIVTRQVLVNGLMNLLGGLFCLGIAIGSAKLFQHARIKAKDDSYSDWDLISIISGVITFVLSLLAFPLMMAALATFLNPEYYAIELLLGFVK